MIPPKTSSFRWNTPKGGHPIGVVPAGQCRLALKIDMDPDWKNGCVT